VKRIPVYLLLILLGTISACTKKVESTEIIKIPNTDPTATQLFFSNQSIYLDTYFTDPDNAIQLQSSNGNNGGSTTILKKSGTTFQPIVIVPQENEAGELTMADRNTGYFAAGNNGLSQLFKTTDGGNTWTNIYTATYGIINIAAPDDNNVFLNSYVGIYKSSDGGKTWSISLPRNSDLGPNAVYFYNNMIGFVLLYSGQMLKTIDGGQNWTNVMMPTTEPISDVFFINATTGFATASVENSLFGTTDGGQTWTRLSQNTLINTGKIFFYPDGRGIIVVRGQYVLYSRDLGKTTKLFYNAVGENSDSNIQAVNDTTLMLSCNKGIYKINFSKN
jgi:photosystem II stability/assembly factor-like uncharacterized protein